MSAEYDLYCAADPYHYDHPENVSAHDDDLFAVLRQNPRPKGWIRVDAEEWVNFSPEVFDFPLQGWKVHVSAHLGNAESVTTRVWEYCLRERLAFKVVPGPGRFRNKNVKYAPRVASGKLFTLYPADETVLHRVLTELGEELRGEEGPYILSDVRWGDGPLYTRYGAFAKRLVDDGNGRGQICIETPEGALEPDPRGVVFTVPEWVALPEFLRPHVDRYRSPVLDDFPYEVKDAIHFSNSGGVYKAVERATGRTVVLKEGRPFAGLDGHDQDAVTRLRRERDMLRHLEGVPQVPALIDYLTLDGHEFLVQEYVDGIPLYSALAKRNPLTHGPRVAREMGDYRYWALGVWERVQDALREVHERGVVFGDLHPNNVMVGEDGQITLIDWEAAAFERQRRRPPMGNPGFMAPPDLRGSDIDIYALALLKIALFAPVTSLIQLAPDKMRHVARRACEVYRLEADTFTAELDFLAGKTSAEPPAVPAEAGRVSAPADIDDLAPVADSWSHVCADIAQGILTSATPHRADRLFPGDIAQFGLPYAGLGFAHGAAGVLWALHRTQGIRFTEGEQWFRERALAERADATAGFYGGDHGIAYALWDLGYRDEAVALLDRTFARGEERLPVDLESGLAGIGLNWLHFHAECGDDAFLQRALRIAEQLRARTPDRSDAWSSFRSPGGALRGPSGPALLFIRLYEATREHAFLDVAAEAIRRDLAKCETDEYGALLLKDEYRLLPYFGIGSAGTGMVINRYLDHVEDTELQVDRAAAASAVNSRFSVFPGLFEGHAGLIMASAAMYGAASETRAAELVAAVDALNWHVLRDGDQRVFPGNQLLRLSTDLATGSAGVLLALHSAERALTSSGPGISLPFFSAEEFRKI
ncbi:class III lanthionine synthetase LanKC [Nocardiopsis valliformis]|uniref:class III lanthionine synthetase LanKC n=1 Tax=Nocardiopsis valliformis TaxID=239974 RepID=UPI000A053D44|nr:class III lanthionine synthetase LanKC [Nocardiopsis valliformis]